MDEAHFHLIVNHFPIIFPIAGIIVMLTGLISKSEAVKRTAYMIFMIGALLTIAAMTSGEGAEDIVEQIAGIDESYIETHEESAETFAILSYILGALSLLGLGVSFKRPSRSQLLSIITFVFALVILYFGQQAGSTGGEIRHTEIRSAEDATTGGSDYRLETEDDE
jgi:uncharacterized membrane protein